MADIHIPQTVSWVTWPASKAGTVHITAALPIHPSSAFPVRPPKTLQQLRLQLTPGTHTGSDGAVPIELKFPRLPFDLMLQTGALCRQASTHIKGLTPQERTTILDTMTTLRARLPVDMMVDDSRGTGQQQTLDSALRHAIQSVLDEQMVAEAVRRALA